MFSRALFTHKKSKDGMSLGFWVLLTTKVETKKDSSSLML